MERDPVCGMEVDRRRVVEQSQYEGDTYYFCSSECKADFDRAPERYAMPRTTSSR